MRGQSDRIDGWHLDRIFALGRTLSLAEVDARGFDPAERDLRQHERQHQGADHSESVGANCPQAELPDGQPLHQLQDWDVKQVGGVRREPDRCDPLRREQGIVDGSDASPDGIGAAPQDRCSQEHDPDEQGESHGVIVRIPVEAREGDDRQRNPRGARLLVTDDHTRGDADGEQETRAGQKAGHHEVSEVAPHERGVGGDSDRRQDDRRPLAHGCPNQERG